MTTATMTEPKEQGAEIKRERPTDVFSRFPGVWKIPREGEIVEGAIISKEGSSVFIDLGFGTGVIYGREYHDGRDMLKKRGVGDTVVSKIIELENEDGYIELSIKEAGREKFWKEAAQVMADKTVLNLKALEANRGGLVFEWTNMKGFLPLSQLSGVHYPRVEGGDKQRIFEELQKLIGEEFSLTVITVDPKEDKLIFSEKSLEPDEMKEKLEKYTVDEIYEGEISGVVEFGVFVKLEDGVEGLVHISELDWALVENPSDLFKVGEKTKVKVIAIEGGKVSLSIKALKDDPWKGAGLEKGDIVEGIIMKVNKYGAFVRLVKHEGLSGLSHVSEFGSLQKMRETIEIGKCYPFQVVVFQPENHKLSLSFLGREGEAAKADASAEAPAKEEEDTKKEEPKAEVEEETKE